MSVYHIVVNCGIAPSLGAKERQTQHMRRVYREARKRLPGFVFKVHFNPGGDAVMGETYAHIYGIVDGEARPVVEAYDTRDGLLVRQWDGRNSGMNHYVQTVEQFAEMVIALASKPFVRF